jgi:hypothetical protein
MKIKFLNILLKKQNCLLELWVEIWQFFLNFGQILIIENLEKHLILVMVVNIFFQDIPKT